jgi:hypothetical protein
MKKMTYSFPRVLSILLCAALTMALTVEYASLEELSLESQVIVYGKIKDSYSVWENKNIYTYTTVNIIQSVKGNLGNKQSITIKQLGGTVGDIGQEISGTPKLKRDSEVFLFLVDWKNNFWIHSIILGYFEVVEREGEKFAINNFNNVHLIDPVTKKPVENIEHIKTSYELYTLMSDVEKLVRKEENNND